MGIFQSDNIWKRQARAQKEAQHPTSENDKKKQELRSGCLWLAGGLIVEVFYAVALTRGIIPWSLSNLAVFLVVGLYCIFSARQIAQLRKK